MKLRETLEQRKLRVRRIIGNLRKEYPEATCALHHRDAFQLLIATILSAQSTDETVNRVTPILFERFSTPGELAAAPRETIESVIHSTGFFRQKAKSIQGASRKIIEEFGGAVPQSMEELISLPGVARKTANVVLGTAFGQNEGVVVDTHVGRLATRLALTPTSKNAKDAVKIEKDLMAGVPRKDWTYLAHALIWHGRRVCTARKPRCDACVIAAYCPSAGMFDGKGAATAKKRLPKAVSRSTAVR